MVKTPVGWTGHHTINQIGVYTVQYIIIAKLEGTSLTRCSLDCIKWIIFSGPLKLHHPILTHLRDSSGKQGFGVFPENIQTLSAANFSGTGTIFRFFSTTYIEKFL